MSKESFLANLNAWRSRSTDTQIDQMESVHLSPQWIEPDVSQPSEKRRSWGKLSKEIVIARYRERIDWVHDLPFPTTIYNHGSPLDIDDPNIEIVDLPNKGREAGCYLEHICRHSLDLADWTFFVQADRHQPVEELWRRLAVEYADTTPLTTMYRANHPSAEVKVKDRVEWIDGVEIHWGLADPEVPGRCDAASCDCDRLWGQYFAGERPDPWWFGYAAQYYVPRRRITDRPVEFWRWVRHLVNASANNYHVGLTNAWSLELLWSYLWGPADQYPVREIPRPTAVTKSRSKGCDCGKDRPKVGRRKNGS